MKRVIVYFKIDDHQFINIEADTLGTQDGYLTVWKGEEMIGIFPLATIDGAYISEKNTK